MRNLNDFTRNRFSTSKNYITNLLIIGIFVKTKTNNIETTNTSKEKTGTKKRGFKDAECIFPQS